MSSDEESEVDEPYSVGFKRLRYIDELEHCQGQAYSTQAEMSTEDEPPKLLELDCLDTVSTNLVSINSMEATTQPEVEVLHYVDDSVLLRQSLQNVSAELTEAEWAAIRDEVDALWPSAFEFHAPEELEQHRRAERWLTNHLQLNHEYYARMIVFPTDCVSNCVSQQHRWHWIDF